MISLIAAASNNNLIGRKNDMIWKIPEDLHFFRDMTKGHIVVMGRKTYESISRRPLDGRTNVIISRRLKEADGAYVMADLNFLYLPKNLLEATLGVNDLPKEVFVIGGGDIYRQAIPYAKRIYMTRVLYDFPVYDGDTFFPDIPEDFKLVQCNKVPVNLWYMHGSLQHNSLKVQFERWDR